MEGMRVSLLLVVLLVVLCGAEFRLEPELGRIYWLSDFLVGNYSQAVQTCAELAYNPGTHFARPAMPKTLPMRDALLNWTADLQEQGRFASRIFPYIGATQLENQVNATVGWKWEDGEPFECSENPTNSEKVSCDDDGSGLTENNIQNCMSVWNATGPVPYRFDDVRCNVSRPVFCELIPSENEVLAIAANPGRYLYILPKGFLTDQDSVNLTAADEACNQYVKLIDPTLIGTVANPAIDKFLYDEVSTNFYGRSYAMNHPNSPGKVICARTDWSGLSNQECDFSNSHLLCAFTTVENQFSLILPKARSTSGEWRYSLFAKKFYYLSPFGFLTWEESLNTCNSISKHNSSTLAMPKDPALEMDFLLKWFNETIPNRNTLGNAAALGFYQKYVGGSNSFKSGWVWLDDSNLSAALTTSFDDALYTLNLEDNGQNCGGMWYRRSGGGRVELDDRTCFGYTNYFCEMIPTAESLFPAKSLSSEFSYSFILPPSFFAESLTAGNMQKFCQEYVAHLFNDSLSANVLRLENSRSSSNILSTIRSSSGEEELLYWDEDFAGWKCFPEGSTCVRNIVCVFNPCVNDFNHTQHQLDCTAVVSSEILNSEGIALGIGFSLITFLALATPAAGNLLVSPTSLLLATGFTVSDGASSPFMLSSGFVCFEVMQSIAFHALLRINYPSLLKSFFISSSWTLGFLPFFYSSDASYCSEKFTSTGTVTKLSTSFGFENPCELLASSIFLYFLVLVVITSMLLLFLYIFLRESMKFKSSWIAVHIGILITAAFSTTIYFATFALFLYSTSPTQLLLASVCLLLSMIVIPGFIFGKIRRFTGKPEQESIRVQCLLLTKEYKIGRFFFAGFDFLSRVTIALIAAVSLSGLTQAILLIVLNLLMLCAALIFRPYKEQSTYRMRLFAYCIRTVSCTLLIPFAVDVSLSDSSALALQVLQILCPLAIFVVMVGVSFRKLMNRKIRKTVQVVPVHGSR